MAVWHGEKGRKPTGGKITLARKKRKYELGSSPIHTTLGIDKRIFSKTKGGGEKIRLLSAEFVNVLDTKTKTAKKMKILDILENPANPHFTRRSILTKGTIVKTEFGKARIVSRPSQHGIVNAVKVE